MMKLVGPWSLPFLAACLVIYLVGFSFVLFRKPKPPEPPALDFAQKPRLKHQRRRR